jgi:DNA adenine methylase
MRAEHRMNRLKAVSPASIFHIGNLVITKTSEKSEHDMSSFFPWMGGKNRTAGKIVQLFPKHECYVEVFSGAANLLFEKEKNCTEVINDINNDLVNLFRIVRWHPRAFMEELQFVLHSRKEFDDYKNQPGLTDVQRAARSWFLLKTSFGGKGGTNSFHFGYGTCGRSRLRRMSFSAVRKCHKRLDGVFVENRDFEDVIKRYDRKHTLFYCDPPYWKTAAYKTPFTWADHQRLHGCLKSIDGKFILTINNHPDIRTLYKGYYIRKASAIYSVSKSVNQDVTELVIANYELPSRLW